MLSIAKKYNSIPNLYKSEAVSIFDLDKVVVSEKIDGTNFSFGFVKGEPVINSRNNLVWIERKGQKKHILQFDGYGAVNRFFELYPDAFHKLSEYGDNILVYGEFYGQNIQNRIKYSEERKFIFFDIAVLKGDEWIYSWYETFKEVCDDVGIPRVSELYVGPPKLNVFDDFLNQPSFLAKANNVSEEQLIEGVVVKGLYSETNKYGDRIIAKHKSEKFTEKEKKNKKKFKPLSEETKGKNAYNAGLAAQYVTESRLHNVLEKMIGESYEKDISSTGELVKRMADDVFDDLEIADLSDARFDRKILNKFIGRDAALLFKKILKDEAYKSLPQ